MRDILIKIIIKKIKKIYFNKIECIIDSLMWVFLESDSVKQKKIGSYGKIDIKF